MIAMDHGVSIGPMQSLEDMQGTIRSVVNGGADAVVVHKGIGNRSTLRMHDSSFMFRSQRNLAAIVHQGATAQDAMKALSACQ